MPPVGRPRITRLLLAGSLVLGLWTHGCGDREFQPGEVTRANPILPVDTGVLWIMTAGDTVQVSVELAETPEQKSTGLMERRTLPEDEGMLFLYDEDQPASRPFYMFRTRIPLDIAFADSAGRIVAMRQMEPCTSPAPQWCETYLPGVPYRSALEVKQGFLDAHGVRIGDRVVLVERAGPGGKPSGT